ncbi:hypothetical protein I302_102898 [Kwoniella bestiolae CBS 10118]|uniref:NADH:flavin oxidoreductase/NADH oxidase N-terminal domain-containing protein n=1 Tax=Kwoniella bestiolae CBS 10118 TaxID=1296100 RepID=A0A1B9GG91_9TREE|nr:hypothetical protein I302_01593 [Kwoniella bestiolae CBS 10118]OCF30074.1 hypothetical protein I302_01593 [Kwoniella bestiolae CBS 10118]
MTITNPNSKLFVPLKAGALDLKHRVVMAPLTRFRAEKGTGVPGEWAAEYYSQRATDGGLIITEATFISDAARGYDGVPGIYTQDQIKGWKKITDGVHFKGGKMVCQLWHLGRVANPEVASTIYAASDIPDPSNEGPKPTLHVMTEQDIDRTVEEYAHAARSAIEAGFDGVEIHGANGYLLDQFLQSVSNQRTDQYGGSLENRFRFPLRVLNAVSEAVGPEKVGIRISPFSTFQGMREPTPLDTFIPWTKAIVAAQPKLAYIHAVEARATGNKDQPLEERVAEDNLDEIRKITTDAGVRFMVAGGFASEGGYPKEHAEKHDDLIAFGRFFISNPDLPARLKNDWPLRKYDRDTFYSPGPKGYVDFHEYQAIAQDDAAHPQ